MRKLTRINWVLLAGLTCLATDAVAQLDTMPSEPNILLLVDNSGSMEWKSSSNTDPVCDPLNPNTTTSTTNEKSRWIELVEAMTGTINNYSCYAEPRTIASGFRDEFQLTTIDPPYDLAYTEAYHRPLSGACAPGPGVMPPQANPYTYPAGAVAYRPFQGTGVTLNPASPCSFSQAGDGLLDAWNGQLRFGLMTFDPQPDPGTGFKADGSADYVSGRHGTWSYYYPVPGESCNAPHTTPGDAADCGGIAGCCVGGPWDCTAPVAYEVGARNASAPPWEGRLVSFGPGSDNGVQRNQWIQEILLATRPYSATPIAGMLSDARDFLLYDQTPDPPSPAPSISGPGLGSPVPTADSCRDTYIVLLTDGEPNLDLRPSCEKGGANKCPYDTPENIASDLVLNGSHKPVRTFVVGFAVGQATVAHDGGTSNIDCSTMDTSICNPTLPTDPTLHACCELNNIAFNGTPMALRGTSIGSPPVPQDHAYFPKNSLELRSALATILQSLPRSSVSRTIPITTSAPPQSGATTDPEGPTVGYEFDSGGVVQGTNWNGVLTRSKIKCSGGVAQVKPVDVSSGDSFIDNVNIDPTKRTIFTVQPDQVGSTAVRQATYSMRPYIAVGAPPGDGVGTYGGTQTAYDDAGNFPADVYPEDLGLAPGACGGAVSTATCSARLLTWIVGLPSASPQSRCPAVGTCQAIGDIFHSEPQVRPGVPSDFLRDSNYSDFASTLSKRDTVLYVSTNDGFLHAFTVSPGEAVQNPTSRLEVKSKANNEQWAFVPPAVLPTFISMYSGIPTASLTRVPVLDGTPVIKDVGVTQGTSSVLDTSVLPYLYERKKAPNTSLGESHTFRTVMVQAFGHGRGGYFALDVTKPSIDSTNPNTTGPRFLWQLTTDDAGNQLFGKGSSTPLITTVYMKTRSTPEPNREVAVAVLPGGIGDSPTSATATCSADASSAIKIDGTSPSAFRSKVRCYDVSGSSKNSIAARSLTIVRLDTGEIVRTFRPATPANTAQPVNFPTGPTSILTDYTWTPSGTKVGLDISAPISGQPVAFPGDTGTVADRIFVGDEEGRIWRIDVSNPDPSLWAMNVFYDPYTDSGSGLDIGQPIQNAPVVSVDPAGQITLAFSTGDQDNLSYDAAQYNYAASVTESVKVATDGSRSFQSHLNWRQPYQNGERVLGPMTLFNKALYYSSFAPPKPGVTACGVLGDSTIYGVDYVKPAGAPLTSGGELQHNPDGTVFQNLVQNAIVPGVALRQLPSCTSGTTTTSGGDGFLGYGTMTTTTTNPGTFQLVFFKSGATAASGGVTPVSTQTMALVPPRTPVRIDSWAPIIE